MYAHYTRWSKHEKQRLIELKGETDTSTIIAEDFKALLLIICQSSRNQQQCNWHEQTFNLTDLSDIYKTLHPTKAKHIFFSRSNRAFNKTKYNSGPLKTIQIIKSTFSDHNGIQIAINNKAGKSLNIWRFNKEVWNNTNVRK